MSTVIPNQKSNNVQKSNTVMLWIGRVITLLMTLAFGMSAFMKFKGGEELAKGMTHLGLPDSIVIPLGILEISCLVIYLIPQTSIIGAILLTGYIGGTILAHWRVGDPFIPNIVIGLLIWLALYFREPRLRSLIPLRTLSRS